MKLATFEASNGRVALGIVTAQKSALSAISRAAPTCDMISLIANWAEWQPALAALATGAGEWRRSAKFACTPPVPRPGKILGIGLNYADHVAEANMARPRCAVVHQTAHQRTRPLRQH